MLDLAQLAEHVMLPVHYFSSDDDAVGLVTSHLERVDEGSNPSVWLNMIYDAGPTGACILFIFFFIIYIIKMNELG